MITIITTKRLQELLRCEALVRDAESPVNDIYAQAFNALPAADVKRILADINIDVDAACRHVEPGSSISSRLLRVKINLQSLIKATA